MSGTTPLPVYALIGGFGQDGAPALLSGLALPDVGALEIRSVIPLTRPAAPAGEFLAAVRARYGAAGILATNLTGVVVDNLTALPPDIERVTFAQDQLREVIANWFAAKAAGTVRFVDAVRSYDPDMGGVQVIGTDERGAIYNVAPEITNGHIASMVLAWLVDRQARQHAAAHDAEAWADDLSGLHVQAFAGETRPAVPGLDEFGISTHADVHWVQ